MSPLTPVHSANYIRSKYSDQLSNPEKYSCQLKSLTQFECTSKVSNEILCLPFRRIFQRCLIPTLEKQDGKNVTRDKWINIEITDAKSNHDLIKDNEHYGDAVREFLTAEYDLKNSLDKESGGRL